MKTLLRSALLIALILGAFASYSAGFRTGVFFFVILGTALEAAFWLNLFPINRTRVSRA